MRTFKHFQYWLALISLVVVFGCPQKKDKAPAEEKPATSGKTATAEKPASQELLPGSWEADVRDNLLKMIAKHGKDNVKYDAANPPVVVFDFDNTCIRGDIGRAFFDHMVSQRKIKFNDLIFDALPADKREAIRKVWDQISKLPADKQADSVQLQEFRKLMHQAYWSLCNQPDPTKCFPWQVRFYAGYTPDQLVRLAAEVMESELKRKLGSEQIKAGPDDKAPAITSTGIRIYKEITDLMVLLRKKGIKVWVVTAGPQWVVTGAARRFAVAEGQVIGMRTKLDKGLLTTEMEPPPTFKEGKVEAIKKFIKVKPILVLGDSWTDAEMMEYAENAILLDRGYADLKKKALDSGWWIQPPFNVQ
ncbi:MAG: haloacid dehalogenase-like hydrolase [Deltaproteobacteria bacterium]|nr:haloacid dehalogenase-like hydrolase [Deltaproteobacteria bacterium]MBW1871847.1 haloacid dehalogenase-like hydrolase [Deltaproteobacteria bacterium]